jgi:hypothetical protein
MSPARTLQRLVGGEDVALASHVNDLFKSTGDSGALRRNGYLRPVPHPLRLKAGKPEIRKQTQKSPSSFLESDGPMTELWCEESARPYLVSESIFKPGTELRNPNCSQASDSRELWARS